MTYEIAGLKVDMQPKFGRLSRQSDAYKSSGDSVMRITPDMYPHAASALAECTDEDREYILCSAEFCRRIIRHGRFFLHASAVVCEGEGYLFSAPAGTGKSTHTQMWLGQFRDSYILQDDKPVICPGENGISVYGTPFSGKTDLNVNRAVPLKAICFLRRGDENRISRITQERAIALILNNTYRPKNGEDMNLLFNMIEQTVQMTDIFEMSCTKDRKACEISYNAMRGKRFE